MLKSFMNSCRARPCLHAPHRRSPRPRPARRLAGSGAICQRANRGRSRGGRALPPCVAIVTYLRAGHASQCPLPRPPRLALSMGGENVDPNTTSFCEHVSRSSLSDQRSPCCFPGSTTARFCEHSGCYAGEWLFLTSAHRRARPTRSRHRRSVPRPQLCEASLRMSRNY